MMPQLSTLVSCWLQNLGVYVYLYICKPQKTTPQVILSFCVCTEKLNLLKIVFPYQVLYYQGFLFLDCRNNKVRLESVTVCSIYGRKIFVSALGGLIFTLRLDAQKQF